MVRRARAADVLPVYGDSVTVVSEFSFASCMMAAYLLNLVFFLKFVLICTSVFENDEFWYQFFRIECLDQISLLVPVYVSVAIDPQDLKMRVLLVPDNRRKN